MPRIILRRFVIGSSILLLMGLLGCQSTEPAMNSRVVVVTISPQAFLVERLAGDLLEIEVMVPPGRAPETYEPTPSQTTRLSNAKIYYSVDVPFERSFLERVRNNLPHLLVVDTTEGIEKREIEEHSHGEAEDHGHEHSHDHGILDPHVWLDPILMLQMAETMKDTLQETYPEWSTTFEENYATLKEDLEKLDRSIAARLQPFEGKSIYVFHPAYGYFCDRFGLVQVPVESAGKEPNSKAFVELIEKAKKDGVISLFVQPQFSSSTVDTLAQEIGGRVIKIDPLESDYLMNLESIAEQIALSFETKNESG